MRTIFLTLLAVAAAAPSSLAATGRAKPRDGRVEQADPAGGTTVWTTRRVGAAYLVGFVQRPGEGAARPSFVYHRGDSRFYIASPTNPTDLSVSRHQVHAMRDQTLLKRFLRLTISDFHQEGELRVRQLLKLPNRY